MATWAQRCCACYVVVLAVMDSSGGGGTELCGNGDQGQWAVALEALMAQSLLTST